MELLYLLNPVPWIAARFERGLSIQTPTKFKNNQGQATVEYLLIIVLAVAAAIALYKASLFMYDQGVASLGGRMEANLRAGRIPATQWARE